MNLKDRIYELYKQGYYPKEVTLKYFNNTFRYDLINGLKYKNDNVYEDIGQCNLLSYVKENRIIWAPELKVAYLQCLFKEMMEEIISG